MRRESSSPPYLGLVLWVQKRNEKEKGLDQVPRIFLIYLYPMGFPETGEAPNLKAYGMFS